MSIRKADPVDRYGRIVPIRAEEYVGQPVIGFVVRMEDGFFAFTGADACEKFDGENSAIEFVERRWRARK